MKKYLLIALLLIGVSARAQSGSASQTITLMLTDAIDITFNTTGTSTGSLVRIPFSNSTEYTGGVQTPDYQLTVRSTKKFNLAINTSDAYFTYNGPIVPAPKMPVEGTLTVMPVSNTAGGVVSSPFSLSQYSSISQKAQNIISGANNGGNQGVAIKYKANPRFTYPGGTYTVDAIFTATQM